MKFYPGQQLLCIRDMPVSPLYPKKGEIVEVEDHYYLSGYVTLKGKGFVGRYDRLAFPQWCFAPVMQDADLKDELRSIFR
jgi:hypothetical protein